ncbi:hypothetical protein [Mycobacterium sp. NPDC050441]|uniref:hypothetical protein n=1 Tax=Mycobacterium sp. NPDC050441 TaxID=3155403 RepID=UPI0033DDA3A2
MSRKQILHVARIVTPVVVGVSAALTNPSSAGANPGGVGDATQIIAEIEARGDRVIVSKTGNKQLSQCTVTGVRQGPAIYRSAPGSPFGTNSPVRNVAYRIFFVDVKC